MEQSWPIQQMSPATLLDELAALASQERREVAVTFRSVSDTFAEVPDGEKPGYMLGVLAYLLDPS